MSYYRPTVNMVARVQAGKIDRQLAVYTMGRAYQIDHPDCPSTGLERRLAVLAHWDTLSRDDRRLMERLAAKERKFQDRLMMESCP